MSATATAAILPAEYQRMVARLELAGWEVEVSTSEALGSTLAHVYAGEPSPFGRRFTFGVRIAPGRPRFLSASSWWGMSTTPAIKVSTKVELRALVTEAAR